MNHLVSFNGSSLPSGNTTVVFEDGKINYSDGTETTLTGSAEQIVSLCIYTSVASILTVRGKSVTSTVHIPASKYVKLTNLDCERLNITTSASFNLWFIAGTIDSANVS